MVPSDTVVTLSSAAGRRWARRAGSGHRSLGLGSEYSDDLFTLIKADFGKVEYFSLRACFPFGDALELTVLTCASCLGSCWWSSAPRGHGAQAVPGLRFAASFEWSPWPLPFLRQAGWLRALLSLAVWMLLQSRQSLGVGAVQPPGRMARPLPRPARDPAALPTPP